MMKCVILNVFGKDHWNTQLKISDSLYFWFSWPKLNTKWTPNRPSSYIKLSNCLVFSLIIHKQLKWLSLAQKLAIKMVIPLFSFLITTLSLFWEEKRSILFDQGWGNLCVPGAKIDNISFSAAKIFYESKKHFLIIL